MPIHFLNSVKNKKFSFPNSFSFSFLLPFPFLFAHQIQKTNLALNLKFAPSSK